MPCRGRKARTYSRGSCTSAFLVTSELIHGKHPSLPLVSVRLPAQFFSRALFMFLSSSPLLFVCAEARVCARVCLFYLCHFTCCVLSKVRLTQGDPVSFIPTGKKQEYLGMFTEMWTKTVSSVDTRLTRVCFFIFFFSPARLDYGVDSIYTGIKIVCVC